MGIRLSYQSKTKARMASLEKEVEALRKAVQQHLRDLNMHGHQDAWKEFKN